MSSARSKSTANGSKPMPRRNTQTSRIWPVTKNSFVTTKTVPIAEHPRNSRNDSCVTKFLKEVNLRAKVPSNKTPKRNKPAEQIGVPNKQERQIPTGHRFSIQKTSVMQMKTMTPRSCLRWKPTGKIFKIVGLRWVPTRKIFASSTTKVDSEPLNGRTQSLGAEKIDISQTRASRNFYLMYKIMTSDHNSSELRLHDHNNEQSSSKLVPDVVPQANKTSTSRKKKDNTYQMMNLPILSVLRHKKLLSLPHTALTRRQLATDPEIFMYALTVSTAKPKNIKEAMADSAWIEAMQEELHQFDRLQ
nr:integrase, catalytic region, zinc finger, CCHC-type, peptidase aspartic, catalytic [Tanacetum cinerariifolium]